MVGVDGVMVVVLVAMILLMVIIDVQICLTFTAVAPNRSDSLSKGFPTSTFPVDCRPCAVFTSSPICRRASTAGVSAVGYSPLSWSV